MSDIWKAMKPFMTGSLAGSGATCCIQPIDMIKVRLQLSAAEGGGVGPFGLARQMVAEEGFLSLYKGLSAGLLRQVVYTGARLGLFDQFTEMAKAGSKDPLPFWKNSVCALSAGGLAAVMGNPADLSLIRMQADSMLPVAERRNYKNVFDAFSHIIKNEGAGGLFKGAVPTATRAMALNFGMLAFNAQAKTLLTDAGLTGAPVVFGASAIAGFFASFFSLPFDFVKTQMQKMKPNADGSMPYAGPLDCAKKQVQKGGITQLWVGFPTYYVRIAPHAMITLILQDNIKQMWGKFNL